MWLRPDWLVTNLWPEQTGIEIGKHCKSLILINVNYQNRPTNQGVVGSNPDGRPGTPTKRRNSAKRGYTAKLLIAVVRRCYRLIFPIRFRAHPYLHVCSRSARR